MASIYTSTFKWPGYVLIEQFRTVKSTLYIRASSQARKFDSTLSFSVKYIIIIKRYYTSNSLFNFIFFSGLKHTKTITVN